jgi:uncharacterized membrane protein
MNSRPIISIQLSIFEKFINVLSVLLILNMFLTIIFQWNVLPFTVPIHFNAAGNVDGWGSKGSLCILPMIGLILFVVISVLERFPHIYNYPVMITEKNAPKLYLEARRMLIILNFEMLLLFSYISWGTVQAAYGKNVISMWTIPLFLIVIFCTIGISLYRLFNSDKS